MENVAWILTGGFAAGYRTYIVAGLAVLTAVANFSLGDATLTETINQVIVGLGLAGLRAAVK